MHIIEYSSLSEKQKLCFDKIKKGESLFITGKAGSGKSYLIDFIKQEFRGKITISASTGISAINVCGYTLHSLFCLGVGTLPVENIIKDIMNPTERKKRERIEFIKLLIIDEVSMLSAHTLDAVDAIAKAVKGSDKPFGGIQVVMFGDFLQLPPVAKSDDPLKKRQSCAHSEVWAKLKPEMIYLDLIFRQTDEKFKDLLYAVRHADLKDHHIELLESRKTSKFREEEIKNNFPVYLYGTNKLVDDKNFDELAKLNTEERTYRAELSGDCVDEMSLLEKNCLARMNLVLKVGSRVMLIQNLDLDLKLANGSLGIITGFQKITENYYQPIVKFDVGIEMVIKENVWERKLYDPKTDSTYVTATLKQIPLIVAYALTIHKCQGLTLESVLVDIASCFCNSQAYVAISRCKSLDKLYIERLKIEKITCDKRVSKRYKELEKEDFN